MTNEIEVTLVIDLDAIGGGQGAMQNAWVKGSRDNIGRTYVHMNEREKDGEPAGWLQASIPVDDAGGLARLWYVGAKGNFMEMDFDCPCVITNAGKKGARQSNTVITYCEAHKDQQEAAEEKEKKGRRSRGRTTAGNRPRAEDEQSADGPVRTVRAAGKVDGRTREGRAIKAAQATAAGAITPEQMDTLMQAATILETLKQ